MSRPLRRAHLLVAVTAAACFDPLYEDGAPLGSGWVLCCAGGVIDTCRCDDPTTCQKPVYACAAGRCSDRPGTCFGASGGGSGTGGGASAGGGTGTGGGGGSLDAGSTADAGTADAGSTFDAGAPIGGGGGSSTGGGGGASGGGGGSTLPEYEFCCVDARVTTCTCPTTGCGAAPFTPCPGNTCVAGSSTAVCR